MIFSGKIGLVDLANGQHSVAVSDISNSQIARMINPVSVSFKVNNPKSTTTPTAATPKFALQFGGLTPVDRYGYNSPYVKVNIEKQPFLARTSNGQKIDVYYYAHWKLHSNASWIQYGPAVKASDSTYTSYLLRLLHGGSPDGPHVSGEIDVQVAARAVSLTSNSVFIGQTSEWSSTQTITIPETAHYSRSTPTVPELSWLAILLLFLSFSAIALLVKKRGMF